MSHWSLGAELIRPGQQLPFSSAKHETCCPELHPSSLPSANFSDSQSQAPSAGEHCLWHLSPGAYSDPLGLTSGGSSHRVTALLKLPISEHTLVIQPHSWAPPKQAHICPVVLLYFAVWHYHCLELVCDKFFHLPELCGRLTFPEPRTQPTARYDAYRNDTHYGVLPGPNLMVTKPFPCVISFDSLKTS